MTDNQHPLPFDAVVRTDAERAALNAAYVDGYEDGMKDGIKTVYDELTKKTALAPDTAETLNRLMWMYFPVAAEVLNIEKPAQENTQS